MKIGFIGLGNMGSGMANNILEKIEDKSNLFVYTRTPEKIAKMATKGAVGCSFFGRNYYFSRYNIDLFAKC